jgi:hypothetical protein
MESMKILNKVYSPASTTPVIAGKKATGDNSKDENLSANFRKFSKKGIRGNLIRGKNLNHVSESL